jgi:cytochrome P450
VTPQRLARPAAAALPPPPPRSALATIPHCGVAPIATDILFLRDTLAFARRIQARCGPVARGMLFARDQVLLLSAEGSEAALFDRAGAFSARGGWEPLLGKLFPGGLILRDGAEHREHRRLMLPALRRDELAAHLVRMAPHIEAAVEGWLSEGTVEIHGAVKRLTLDIAADVFIGTRLRDEVDAINRDFVALVDASAAIVRLPLPGLRYTRGLNARARLVRFLRDRLAALRGGTQLGGADLLSRLAMLAADEPETIDDDALVDHLVFLLMAAHDTTTSAVTQAIGLLADHPDHQAALRDEALAEPDGPPTPESLQRQAACGRVLRETLRLYPPIPTLSRLAVAPVALHGHVLPPGTMVTAFPLLVQRDPRWWSNPDRFDPDRFAPHRAEDRRHPFAWSPFGGGAHACLGQHFATLQATAILRALLRRATIERPAGAPPALRFAPIAHPVPGLPVRLRRIAPSPTARGVGA